MLARFSGELGESQVLETFQDYALQFLPAQAKRKFEIIIEEKLKPLETELRLGMNMKEIVSSCLSELFKSWQERSLSPSFHTEASTQQDALVDIEEVVRSLQCLTYYLLGALMQD